MNPIGSLETAKGLNGLPSFLIGQSWPRINIHGYKVGTTHIQLAEADAVDIYRPKVSTSLKWKIYIAHYSYTPKKLRIPTGVNDASNDSH